MSGLPPLSFFTICSKNFLAYAHTLYRSVQAQHPGARFYVALCDRVDGMLDPSAEPFEIIELDDLPIPDLPGMIARYNITELNTSIKPFVFEYLFERRDARRVVYLDPDILVVSPLSDVDAALGARADAVMTPHVLDPAEHVEIDDIKMLQLGIYNLGFLALNRTPRTLEIVRWWQRRLETQCVIDLPNGLFVDQKWADLLPCFIPDTLVLRHPGYNVAYWNLQQREVVRGPQGWTANGRPLVFVHFSGNNLDDESVFSRHSWQLNAANVGPINELLREYRAQVFANGHARYSVLPYAFSWNGASGVNLHTPEKAGAVASGGASIPSPDGAPPAAATLPAAPVSAAIAQAPCRPARGASSPGMRRLSNAVVSLRRARAHAGGWGPMLAKGMRVYRRGGLGLVRATIRQLNLIHPRSELPVGVRTQAPPTLAGGVPRAPRRPEDGAERGRLLFVDWSTPRPDHDAGSITAFYLMKILVDLGYDVVFVPSDLKHLGHYTEALRGIGVTCLCADDIGSMEAHLQAEGDGYDVAFLCRAPIAALYIDAIRRHAPRAKIVLNTSDLHYLRDVREAEIEGSPEKMEAALRWKAQELDVIGRCDHSIVMSDHELKVLSAELPGASIHLVPLMFVDIPGRDGGFAERRDMLFIGGFPHTPNVDAVVWFCERIWPAVRARLPDARIHLIGNKPPEQVRALGAIEGVNVVGYVEDLKPWFDRTRISVAPLRYGAGIKGKLGTSLSYGLPAVATSIAVEGMKIRDGEHALVADEERAFADQVVRLYTDEALWTRLSDAGLDFVAETYSVQAGLRRIDAFMHLVADAPPPFPATSVRDAQAYARYFADAAPRYAQRDAYEEASIPPGVEAFRLPGACAVCNRPSWFNVGFMYSCQTRSDGGPMPNWREHLDCVQCGFINRIRAALHAFRTRLAPSPDAAIYITEQTTPLYRWLRERYPGVRGSEYLADKVAPGAEYQGLRNENIMATTWDDASFDFVLSFDVLEHVPDPFQAFVECHRILRPGGAMLWAAPFAFDEHGRMREHNVVRARLGADGEIEHLMEPEYHGNPVDPENGALCFQYFGLETLSRLRAAGFADAELLFYWSPDYAYLGREQLMCIARKAA